MPRAKETRDAAESVEVRLGAPRSATGHCCVAFMRNSAALAVSFVAGWWCNDRWNGQRAAETPRRLQSQKAAACWLEQVDGESVQTAFLRLHAWLFGQQLLPVAAFGGKRAAPSRDELRQLVGPKATYRLERDAVRTSTSRALSRLAFVRFLGRQMSRYGPLAAQAAARDSRKTRCLEWDGKWYLDQYRVCQETWTFAFSKRPFRLPDHKGLFGDLELAASQHPDMVGTFDIIFCNQVFEHVSRPHMAAASVAALLRPGGFLIWSAPFLEPTHAVPHDYFRFTVSGGAVLFRDVGLKIVATELGGDSMLTSLYLLGYSAGELNATQVSESLVMPVTSAELQQISSGDSYADLARKLYFSSFLVAQAPLRAGQLKMWSLHDGPPANSTGHESSSSCQCRGAPRRSAAEARLRD